MLLRVQCRLHSVTCVIINFYRWHQVLLVPILLPQIIIIFQIHQYWVQWYAVIQIITQVWPILSVNLTVKSYGNFALSGCYNRSLLMIHFISFEAQFYVNCQYVIQYSTQHRPVITFNEWSLSHGGNHWHLEWRIPWTNAWTSIKYFVSKCGFRPVHIWLSTSWYLLGLNAGAFHPKIKMWIILRSETFSNAGSYHIAVFHSL